MTEAWDKTLVKRVERERRLKSEEKQAWRTQETQRLTADEWRREKTAPVPRIDAEGQGIWNWAETGEERMDRRDRIIQSEYVAEIQFKYV